MRRFLLSLAALPFTTLIGGCQSSATASSGTTPGVTPDTPFGRQLGRAREKASLPAVAGARVTLDGPPVTHAFGVRRLNAKDPVTDDDHFHLGSNSKAITATLPGALVEDGVLTWERTIGASFPELAAGMRDDVLRAATIRALHEPDGEYALGWGVQRNLLNTVHFHEGSAGTFHMVTLLDPQRGIAVATVTNAGGECRRARTHAVHRVRDGRSDGGGAGIRPGGGGLSPQAL